MTINKVVKTFDIRHNERVRLIKTRYYDEDEPNNSQPIVAIGTLGVVVAMRWLDGTDDEAQYLIKFQGKAGHVSMPRSYIEKV